MAAFAEVYPDQGVLLVVDEFLEYLRSRKDHDLVLDLSFLREIGEVTKHLRFRFVAGVQEAIFDSSRFQHVADSLRRVKDRFTQVLLARQDVSFVVAERLLKKSADQQDKIRAYLTPFAKFYGTHERAHGRVRAPVPRSPGLHRHLRAPDLHREARRPGHHRATRSRPSSTRRCPTDRPGPDRLRQASGRPSPPTRCCAPTPASGPVLQGLRGAEPSGCSKAFTRPAYKPMALRVIAALSVHRLTTGGDIYVPVGPTAEELRDTLCLYQPGIEDMGGEPADDLLSARADRAARDRSRPSTGSSSPRPPDTEQYYLDLKKDIDYDAQIEKRAEALSDDALDRAYYSAIKQLMERTDETTYVTGLPDLAVPDRVAGAPRRPQGLSVLRRPERPPHGAAASATSTSTSSSPSSHRASATRTCPTRCSSASRGWTTTSSAIWPSTPPRWTWPPPPAAAPRPSTSPRRKTPCAP